MRVCVWRVPLQRWTGHCDAGEHREDPPMYQRPEANDDEYDNANPLPRGLNQGKPAPYWTILCEIREWTLELSAPAVDTTSVAEKFGNAVKSLVTGGGSVEFFIDRQCLNDDQKNDRVDEAAVDD